MNEENVTRSETDTLRVLQTKGERKAFYNKIARFYDLLTERSEHEMREAGLAKLAASPGEHLLEIGFGTGHCLVELAEAVGPLGKIFGIDLSENMLARARNLLREENLQGRVELQCGDGEHLPYADGTMDGVFISFALELFDTSEIPAVLSECRRVLRPGGRLVVVGMSKEGGPGLLTRAFEWTHQHFPNLLDCRPIHVRRAVETAGFRIEDAEVDTIWVPVEIVKAVKDVGETEDAARPQSELKVNIDDSPELAARYGVKSVPSIMVFKDGQVVAKQEGVVNKTRLKSMIDL